ncbi:trypsin-like peptidase domain-containing protein [Streptomyces qaidamensis]|uniref:trypsin-like peptidase domain-containing protein n=1 Tax=Streptomyces qaidamensis TaxID=1783515 RepID=UPI001F241F3A|nr:trypsin-like peptidase domain-containing protein [Streptomyces qaidamensis]
MNLNTPGWQLLFSTARIVNKKKSGATTSGTGFLLMAELENGRGCPMLVTNKHVVEDAETLTAHLITRKSGADEPNFGKGAEVDLPSARCVGHPSPRVDVAVIPLAPVWNAIVQHCFTRALPTSMLTTEVEDFYVDAIEEITFVGYPNGHYDRKHLTPIVRRGITATPLDLDMDGDPTFLVDGSVFGGSSGSPVFLLNEGAYNLPDGMALGKRVALVGIIAATKVRHAQLPLAVATAPHVKLAQELNLGVAFNASAIRETIEALLATSGERLKTATGGNHAPLPTTSE